MNFIVPSVAREALAHVDLSYIKHNALLQITTASVSKSFQKFVNPSIRIRWSINSAACSALGPSSRLPRFAYKGPRIRYNGC